MAGFGAELSIVLCSFGLFIVYHIWFFCIHGTGMRTTKPQARDGRDDKFVRGKLARIQFADLVCRDNDTIAGIQQSRNALIGVSFLAGTVSLLAQKILSIILDIDQQEQMKAFAVRSLINMFSYQMLYIPNAVRVSSKDSDPIVANVQIAPGVVLGVNFVGLMISMLCFAQAVRMYIHALKARQKRWNETKGYFYKAASMGTELVTVADTAEVIIQAQVAQTIGMRILFFFPVTAAWLIGPTAMLVSAVVTVSITAYLDFVFFSDKSFMDLLLNIKERSPLNGP